MSALAAAGASAKLPEWGKCQATGGGTGGKYSDAGCTVKAHKKKGVYTGGYEWTTLAGEFQLRPMALAGTLVFETTAGKKIECTGLAGESHAELRGASGALTPLWELEGCQSEGQGCKSEMAFSEGEINNTYAWYGEPAEEGGPTPGWTGQLGFIAKGGPSPVVGMAYTVKNDERLFEPVVCHGAIGTVWIGGAPKGGDSFISAIAPVDQMSTEYTETYSSSAPGVQNPTKFAGGKRAMIEAFLENHWEPVAINGTFHYLTEESGQPIEIKAIP